MNLEQAQEITKKLITQLELEDWEIHLFEDSEMKTAGKIEYVLANKKSDLFINFQRAEEEKDLFSTEGITRHELLHIILCPLADLVMSLFNSILNEVSKSLVEAAYDHIQENVIEHLNRILEGGKQ